MKRRFTIMGFLLATVVVAGIVLNRSQRKSQVPVMPQAYADPKSCSQCHASEAVGYANSGMAHAYVSVGKERCKILSICTAPFEQVAINRADSFQLRRPRGRARSAER